MVYYIVYSVVMHSSNLISQLEEFKTVNGLNRRMMCGLLCALMCYKFNIIIWQVRRNFLLT